MLYLHKQHMQKVFDLRQTQNKAIMIEICPSTSFFVLNLRSYADHPYIRKFYSMHQPISLNTDDTAIFNTTLTKEILHMMYALDWQPRDILLIQARAIPHLFASPAEKASVARHFWQEVARVQQSLQTQHTGATNSKLLMLQDLEEIREDNLDEIERNNDNERAKLITSSLEVF